MQASERQEVDRHGLSIPAGDQTSHVDLYDVDNALSTILFYHGNITFAAFYQRFFEEVASRGHRVLAADRIGMGQSSGRRGRFTVTDLWNQANGLLDFAAERHEGPFVAMGHSVGGTLAYEQFMAEPRLAACVANNIRHPSSESESFRDKVELTLFKAGARIFPGVQLDTLGVVEGEAERMSEPDRICIQRILAGDGSAHAANDFSIGSLAAYIRFRAPGDHTLVDRPLLLLVGELDTEHEIHLAREAKSRISGPVTLEVMHGAGHFLLATHPEESAETVDEWLRASLAKPG